MMIGGRGLSLSGGGVVKMIMVVVEVTKQLTLSGLSKLALLSR